MKRTAHTRTAHTAGQPKRLTWGAGLAVPAVQRLPGHLQQQPLLRVHQLQLVGSQGKEGGIKGLHPLKPAAKARPQQSLARRL